MRTSMERFYGVLREFIPVRSFVSYDHTFILVYVPFTLYLINNSLILVLTH
jgi:hypothetical protein